MVTSVEKRFKIKSFESGIIASCYEFACFASLLPVSYFGRFKSNLSISTLINFLGGKGNKPLWMGVGLIIQAFGVFLYILPHFISDYQQLDVFYYISINFCLFTVTYNRLKMIIYSIKLYVLLNLPKIFNQMVNLFVIFDKSRDM